MNSNVDTARAKRFYTVGLILLSVVLAAFLVSLFWTPYDPYATDAASKLLAPSAASMRITTCEQLPSAAGVAIALVLGTVTGLPAGYFGGFADKSIMLLNNSIMCFPGILLALVAVAVFGASMFNVVWALGLVFAPTFARVYRAGTLEIKEYDYITHARVMGVHPVRIMLLHILPNLVPQLLPATVIGLANMTLFESGMSYLGLGVQPPDASFGKMLAESQAYIRVAPWLVIFPSLMLVFYILGLYFVSEGMRVSLTKGGGS